MSERLREMMRRGGRILASEVEAARLWASDLRELGCDVRCGRMDAVGKGQGTVDIMRVAIRRRVAAAEAALHGSGSPMYLVAMTVLVEDRTVGEAAAKLDIRTTSATDLLYMAARALARVYQMREQRLTT